MNFANRHEVEEHLAQQAAGGVIVEIGCGFGNGILALHRGTSRGANLPLFGIDPYEPYVDRTGGTYGPSTLIDFRTNTAGTGVTLIQQPATVARVGWNRPVALLWIDVGMDYDDLRVVFDAWQDAVVEGGVIGITGLCYAQHGTARLAEQALKSGAFDSWLTEQGLVAVLVKR